MKIHIEKVGDKKPNDVLSDWLLENKNNYVILVIVLCKDDEGKLYWHIYHES
jgi:hypothetical protein